MNVNLKELRDIRLQYEDTKGDLTDTCRKVNEYARFLGCEQKDGKEDVRISLAFIEGFISAIEQVRSKK